MELDPQRIVRAPVEALRFIGQRLLGGAWSELPHAEQPPVTPPQRLVRGIVEINHMGD